MSIATLAEELRAGRADAVELAAAALERAQACADLNAFVTLHEDEALAAARQAQQRLDSADSPLCGVPIAHKDIYCTRGIATTCASRILEKFVPPYESHATALVAKTGAVSIGKCNMDEFGMGTTGENSAFGATKNPWSDKHSPGGSSSGSAAAVAARIVPAATGTDTGGSVRMPAAYCGICGIKPTYGMISRRGIVAYASSLDQAGAFATSAADLRLILGAMVGHDPQESTSLADAALPEQRFEPADLKNMRIGVAREFFGAGVDEQVGNAVRAAVDELGSQGARIVEVSIPRLEHAIPAYYIIACAEASSNLARYDGLLYGRRVQSDDLTETVERSRSEGFGVEVQRRIMLGTFVLSHGYVDAYYRQAQKVRHLLARDFASAFADCDAIATPAAPTTAPLLGAFDDDPVLMYSQDICTAPANMAGLPAIAFPCGLVDGLPAGIQLIGPARSEHSLLGIAEIYQQRTEHHLLAPQSAA